jgi:tetratricopeptide (TPR) repeat protein
MGMMNIGSRCLVLLALLSSPAWGQDRDPEEQAQIVVLGSGIELLKQRRPAEAITSAFDKVIARYDEKFGTDTRKIYAARTAQESLLYLLQSANAKQPAVIVSFVWSDGYYYKGFALVELGRFADARIQFDRALTMSPMNAYYLEELGDLNTRQKDWPAALEKFHLAEEAARAYSPPAVKNRELARAWRGIAYVLVEQNKLDEAENLYRQCLELDKDDQRAANELKYVLNQKAKMVGAPK